MNELVYIEDKLRRLRESTYNPDYYLNGSIRDILSQSSIEIAKAENYEVSFFGDKKLFIKNFPDRTLLSNP